VEPVLIVATPKAIKVMNLTVKPKRLFEKSKLLPEPPPSPPIWGILRFNVPQIGGLRGQIGKIASKKAPAE
jgi:hypothetical protein